jgi:hypothetical protein
MRLGLLVIGPFPAVEKDFEHPVPQQEEMFSSLTERPIKAAAGDPFVDRFCAKSEEASDAGR